LLLFLAVSLLFKKVQIFFIINRSSKKFNNILKTLLTYIRN
jgi:hypothetical protein